MSLFYKTDHADVLAAYTLYEQQLNQMRDEGLAFRDSFSAKNAIFQYSIDDNRLFEPPKDSRFWTKPDRENGTQYPRQKVTTRNPCPAIAACFASGGVA